jgi:hypothetical protein
MTHPKTISTQGPTREQLTEMLASLGLFTIDLGTDDKTKKVALIKGTVVVAGWTFKFEGWRRPEDDE